jgi:hypothetical protein
MNEMFAFIRAEYISLGRRLLGRVRALRQYLADAKPRQSVKEASAFLLSRLHDNLPL